MMNLDLYVKMLIICTTAAESPWSKGIVERRNATLGVSVQKIIDDLRCDLSLAVAWAVSAKNDLRNVHGFSPSQLVFGKQQTPCFRRKDDK